MLTPDARLLSAGLHTASQRTQGLFCVYNETLHQCSFLFWLKFFQMFPDNVYSEYLKLIKLCFATFDGLSHKLTF